MKVPPDFRGDGLVAAVFANEAGIVSDRRWCSESKSSIPCRRRNIEGKVVFGERPQPGVSVSLGCRGETEGLDHNERKGPFEFAEPRSVATGSSHSGIEHRATGIAPVVVEADKTTPAQWCRRRSASSRQQQPRRLIRRVGGYPGRLVWYAAGGRPDIPGRSRAHYFFATNCSYPTYPASANTPSAIRASAR